MGVVVMNELKRMINDRFREIEKKAKRDECKLCHAKCTSFCNSHTIPKFILRRIAIDGHVDRGALKEHPLYDHAFGINNALTFKTICDKCDNTRFQTYESSKLYESEVSNELLQEIALKNYLWMEAKRYKEKKLYESIPNKNASVCDRLKICELDLHEYEKQILNWNKKEYTIIYDVTLEYEVPVSIQIPVCLITGIEKQIINNIYNKNPDYKTEEIHLCIFPLENKTRILLFMDRTHRRYRKFRKDFMKLSDKQKLYCINYMMLIYSEDWLISHKYLDKIVLNDETKNVIQTTTDYFAFWFEDEKVNKLEIAIDKFLLKTEGDVFNFLEYKSH